MFVQRFPVDKHYDARVPGFVDFPNAANLWQCVSAQHEIDNKKQTSIIGHGSQGSSGLPSEN